MVDLAREVIEIEDDDNDYGELLEGTFTLDDAGEGFLPIDHFRDQPPRDWGLTPELANSPLKVLDPEELYQDYRTQILGVFPDICLDHIKELFNARIGAVEEQPVNSANEISQAIITQILDNGKYPKEKDKRKNLKRKRSTNEGSDNENIKWTSQDRSAESYHYTEEIRGILQREFINIPQRYIDLQVKEKKFLYPVYVALELAERTYNETSNPPFHKLKSNRKHKGPRSGLNPSAPMNPNVESELRAVKGELHKQAARRRKVQEAIDADLAIDKECEERGDMVECQCCFTDTPIPKSTYCNGEDAHFFCFNCARSYAKSQTELSRYKLSCMDGSGCQAEFTRTQIYRFLDQQMIDLLERLQQQDELRAANLANLENCPFCDYAAICEPIEIDKEFHCCMPSCERVSCRLCKQDSHLPKTCEEYRKENGLTERHVLEEAMTKALIRECPKCHVPILKDGGCNKLTCSKCNSYICDYCGKDITKAGYAHFQPEGAGKGATGCPATDNTEQRNAKRIEEAEKAAMAKIREENPTLSEDDLKIKFSEKVQTRNRPTIPENLYQAYQAHQAHQAHFPPHIPPFPFPYALPYHNLLQPMHPPHYMGENFGRLGQDNQVPDVAQAPLYYPRERDHQRLDREFERAQQRLQEVDRLARENRQRMAKRLEEDQHRNERLVQEHRQRAAQRVAELQQRNEHLVQKNRKRAEERRTEMEQLNAQACQQHVELMERHRAHLEQARGLNNLFDREMENFRNQYLPQHQYGMAQGLVPDMNLQLWQPYGTVTAPLPPRPYIPDVPPMPNTPYPNGPNIQYNPVPQYGGIPDAR